MSDYMTAGSIGERVKALRKRRGIKSVQDLVDLMPGSRITVATVENLESGRRAELGISQLLNIAFALQTPPIFLLAAMGRPKDKLDLGNLTAGIAAMTASEFDAWLSGNLDGPYRWGSVEELAERNVLNALRNLASARQELKRLQDIRKLGNEVDPKRENASFADTRINDTEAQIRLLENFLRSAGWPDTDD